MRKIFLALLVGGLCAPQPRVKAAEMAQAGNFSGAPAKQTGSVPANAPSDSAAPRPGSEAERFSRDEITRRQEAQMMAQPLIEQGLKLYNEKDYEGATNQLEQALKILPRAKATESDYTRAAQALTDSYCHLAEAALRQVDTANARQLAQKSLELDPHNRCAENVIADVKKADRGVAPIPGEQATPDNSPEFLAKKDAIRKLFREARILLNSGQYDEAEKRTKQILVIDSYNEDASALLQQIDDSRLAYAENASERSRSHRLWQVTDSWVPKVTSEVKVPMIGSAQGPMVANVSRQANVLKKLNDIVFPEISFREAVISDVVGFLSEESRRLDPDKVGVNIVLGAVGAGGVVGEPTPTPAAAPPPATGSSGVDAGAPSGPTGGQPPPPSTAPAGTKITLNLRNVSMLDALSYVTTLANLKYRIASSAVLILPLDAPEGEMETRVYSVTPGVFGTRSAPLSSLNTQSLVGAGGGGAGGGRGGGGGGFGGGGGGGAGGVGSTLGAAPVALLLSTPPPAPSTTEVREFFQNAGVQFPTNSTLVLNSRTSQIIIKNTPKNLEDFEKVLQAINIVPSQVEIEAKFVEVSQNDLNELGFQWNLAGKQLGNFAVAGGPPSATFGSGEGVPPSSANNNLTVGLQGSAAIQGNAIDSLLAANGFGSVASPQDQIATIRGILTNPQFELIIKALNQKKGADLLSAPKITTMSGHQAQVRIAQEFIYPTTFSQPTATAAGGGVSGGGAVAVTPSIPSSFSTREVGVLLDVIPTVGADGYTINLSLIPEVADFLGFINYGGPISLAAGGNVVTTFNDIKQPLFTTRTLATSVVIWDGQTVVLGGLIREDVQKIDDKIPFLGDIPMFGRLFQSKVSLRTKRNLLIFVSARLVDPAGNPIHRQDTAAFR